MDKSERLEFIEKAKNGDRAAFEKLYQEYRNKLYFFVLKNAGTKEAAEDIVSETFLTAMEKINTLKSSEAFGAWLYSVAYNKCMDYLGDSSRTEHFETDEEREGALLERSLAEPVMLPSDYAESSEAREQVREVINGLDKRSRSAVILYYYEELSLKDTAKAMGVSENAAKQRLFRARQKIKKGIEKHFKGAALCAVPLGAALEGSIDTGFAASAKAAAVSTSLAGKIIAASAVAVVGIGVPLGIYAGTNGGFGILEGEDSSHAQKLSDDEISFDSKSLVYSASWLEDGKDECYYLFVEEDGEVYYASTDLTTDKGVEMLEYYSQTLDFDPAECGQIEFIGRLDKDKAERIASLADEMEQSYEYDNIAPSEYMPEAEGIQVTENVYPMGDKGRKFYTISEYTGVNDFKVCKDENAGLIRRELEGSGIIRAWLEWIGAIGTPELDTSKLMFMTERVPSGVPARSDTDYELVQFFLVDEEGRAFSAELIGADASEILDAVLLLKASDVTAVNRFNTVNYLGTYSQDTLREARVLLAKISAEGDLVNTVDPEDLWSRDSIPDAYYTAFVFKETDEEKKCLDIYEGDSFAGETAFYSDNSAKMLYLMLTEQNLYQDWLMSFNGTDEFVPGNTQYMASFFEYNEELKSYKGLSVKYLFIDTMGNAFSAEHTYKSKDITDEDRELEDKIKALDDDIKYELENIQLLGTLDDEEAGKMLDLLGKIDGESRFETDGSAGDNRIIRESAMLPHGSDGWSMTEIGQYRFSNGTEEILGRLDDPETDELTALIHESEIYRGWRISALKIKLDGESGDPELDTSKLIYTLQYLNSRPNGENDHLIYKYLLIDEGGNAFYADHVIMPDQWSEASTTEFFTELENRDAALKDKLHGITYIGHYVDDVTAMLFLTAEETDIESEFKQAQALPDVEDYESFTHSIYLPSETGEMKAYKLIEYGASQGTRGELDDRAAKSAVKVIRESEIYERWLDMLYESSAEPQAQAAGYELELTYKGKSYDVPEEVYGIIDKALSDEEIKRTARNTILTMNDINGCKVSGLYIGLMLDGKAQIGTFSDIGRVDIVSEGETDYATFSVDGGSVMSFPYSAKREILALIGTNIPARETLEVVSFDSSTGSCLAISGSTGLVSFGIDKKYYDEISGLKGMKCGDLISIMWSGEIAESYPGQITGAEPDNVIYLDNDFVGKNLERLIRECGGMTEYDEITAKVKETEGLSDFEAEALVYLITNGT